MNGSLKIFIIIYDHCIFMFLFKFYFIYFNLLVNALVCVYIYIYVYIQVLNNLKLPLVFLPTLLCMSLLPSIAVGSNGYNPLLWNAPVITVGLQPCLIVQDQNSCKCCLCPVILQVWCCFINALFYQCNAASYHGKKNIQWLENVGHVAGKKCPFQSVNYIEILPLCIITNSGVKHIHNNKWLRCITKCRKNGLVGSGKVNN